MTTKTNSRFKTYAAVAITACVCLLVGCNKSSKARAPSEAPPNDAYVILTGTVTHAEPDAFLLDYGDGTIIVEMDDFDAQEEGRTLEDGDKVVVHGFVDDDFYEQRSIEAGSVYVRNLDTQFYASGWDEEDFPPETRNLPDATISLTGTIQAIAGRELTLQTEYEQIRVDTKSMDRNPFDQVGHQRLAPGDRVHVLGTLNKGVFEGLEIEAENVISLDDSDS